MNDESNALTEVALAMAMAFFALFVLVAISIGLPGELMQAPHIVVASVQDDAPKKPEAQTLLVYIKAQLFDDQLKPVALSTLEPAKAYLLAVPPTLSMRDVMDIKSQLGSLNVSLTLLDDAWLARISE